MKANYRALSLEQDVTQPTEIPNLRSLENIRDLETNSKESPKYKECLTDKISRIISETVIFSAMEFGVFKIAQLAMQECYNNEDYFTGTVAGSIFLTGYTWWNYQIAKIFGKCLYNMGEKDYQKRTKKEQEE